MSDDLMMVPPQIQVGAGQHTVQVQTVDDTHGLRVTLAAGPTVFAVQTFPATQIHEMMPWLAREGHQIGEQLDKVAAQKLRRAGYKV